MNPREIPGRFRRAMLLTHASLYAARPLCSVFSMAQRRVMLGDGGTRI